MPGLSSAKRKASAAWPRQVQGIVAVADHVEDFDLGPRVLERPPAQLREIFVEQLAGRGGPGAAALGVGGAHQLGQEAADLVGAVALLGDAVGLALGEQGEGGKQQQHGGGDGDRQAVAAEEFADQVERGLAGGPHRLAVEITAQVFFQLGDRGVAVGGQRPQRLGDDVVEIAAQLPGQPAAVLAGPALLGLRGFQALARLGQLDLAGAFAQDVLQAVLPRVRHGAGASAGRAGRRARRRRWRW